MTAAQQLSHLGTSPRKAPSAGDHSAVPAREIISMSLLKRFCFLKILKTCQNNKVLTFSLCTCLEELAAIWLVRAEPTDSRAQASLEAEF